ncbi:hypothetical protein CSOJ01_13951 [Colletotrichum sojae]|uniref:Protein ssh4 n=1 Tax=Colletotrichum sojae TaxID=2175907 RepID=A0A8H6IRT3_9PEZI|nr:hypothetical protein CSOJ01_13951 [Colletotrichum sojae]
MDDDRFEESQPGFDPEVVVDFGLGVVSETESQFRFNSEGVFTPRETAVLVRCSLADMVHGKATPDDGTPCTLLGATLEGGITRGKYVSMDTTDYATVTGFTTHEPRVRPNDPRPHNCVKWVLLQNQAGKRGVPPHFQAAVLLERDNGDEPFDVEVVISAKVDLKTAFEDLTLLMGKPPQGCLSVDPRAPNTNFLRRYDEARLASLVGDMWKLSAGALETEQFSRDFLRSGHVKPASTKPRVIAPTTRNSLETPSAAGGAISIMTSSFTEAFFQEDNTPDKDIVVVHGLSCTGDRPWVDTDNRPAWLKQDLFEGSNARIIGFNYEAISDDSQLDIRPLAFLGHDLGGIVVKMRLPMLWYIASSPSTLTFCLRIILLKLVKVFIGCPHRTLSLASLTDDVATLIYNTRKAPQFGLLETARLCATTLVHSNYLFLESNVPLQVQMASVFSQNLDRGKRENLVGYGLSPKASGLLSMDEFADWTQSSQSSHAARYLLIPKDRSTPSVINEFVRFISENNKHTSRSRFRIFSFQFRRLKLHPDIDMGHSVDGTRLVLAGFVAQALACTMPRMTLEARPPSLSNLLSTLELASPELLTEYFLKLMFVQLNLCLWGVGIQAIWSVWDLDQCAGEEEAIRLVQVLQECFQFTEFKPCILLSGSEPSMFGLPEIMRSVGVPPLNLRPRYGTPIDVETRIAEELELLEVAKTMDRIFRWVLHARRPSSPLELVAALALEDSIADTPRHDTTAAPMTEDGRDDGNGFLASFHAIEHCLSGLIRVVDDEVHLSFAAGVDSLAKPGLDGVNLSHLDAYAVHFWPHHYKLAQCHPPTQEKAESYLASFLKQETAAVSMMLRYFQIGSPQTPVRAEGGEKPVTAVALLARCGFTDIGEIGTLTSCPGWEADPEMVFPALLEAVRGGHGQLVRELPMSLLDNNAAESILSSTGQLDRDVMIHLFRQTRSRDNFQLPPAFRYHAACVGIEEIVEKIHKYPADGDLWRNCMLRAAFAHGFEVFEILALHAISSLDIVDKNLILEAASQIRGPADIRTLRNLLSIEVNFERLYAPAISGNHLLVEDLLSQLFKDGKPIQYLPSLEIKPSLYEVTSMSSVEVVKAILKYVDPVRESESLLSALHLAVETSASAETCALFLDTGVDLENWNGNTFLVEAVLRDNMELAKLFVDHGVSIDAKNPEGEGALFLAAIDGLLPMVEFLLDEHADVNGKTEQGLTPLYGASLNNKPEVVDCLLNRGADARITTDSGSWSPLEAAYDFPAVLRLLLTKAAPHLDYKRVAAFGDTEVTALFLTARSGSVESARLLLEHGDPDLEFAPSADIDEDNPAAGYTPLAIAAQHSNTDIVRLLLEKGANVNHRVQWRDQTVLHCAWTEETVAILLEYGADIEAKDSNGTTPLHWSSTKENTGLIRRLANAGAKLEEADKFGQTPLISAVVSECLENFRYLVSKGSPINRTGGRFGSPLHSSCAWKPVKTLRFIAELGGDVNLWHGVQGTPLKAACIGRPEYQLSNARYLVEEKSVDVNAESGYCRSIMGQAFLTGTTRIITYILENGGNIDATDGTGLPSLFNICFRHTDVLEVFDMLLESYSAVVSIDTRDHTSRTILHCAALAGHLELVEKLVKLERALLRQRDHDGWSALHWAARQPGLGDTDNNVFDQDPQSKANVIKFLVRNGCPGLGEKVSAGGRTWTAMEIAKYHDAPDVVIDAVRDMIEENCVTEDAKEASPTAHDSSAGLCFSFGPRSRQLFACLG